MSKSAYIDDYLARESKAIKGRAMHLAERVFEGFRIYAAALQVPGSLGFNAGVVVKTERAVEGTCASNAADIPCQAEVGFRKAD